MASTYLSRTPSSAGNRQKWTWSAWIKLSNFAGPAGSMLFSAYAHANDEFRIYFGDTYKLGIRFYNGTEYQLSPNRLFRDTNAWYHLVVTVDTTLATSTDRFKIYVNGVRETSFGAESQPTQNLSMTVNDTTPIQIGRHGTGTNYFDGYMSHVHLCDGYAYDASDFGETDATTGIWKPKTSPSVTYGTNGFFLKFENSGSMGTDSSGNGNNLTVNGTMTQTVDTPSNVFATQNSLQYVSSGCNLSLEHGNTTVSNDCSVGNVSTLGASSGKYYWEGKLVSFVNGNSGSGPNVYEIGVNGSVFGTNIGFSGSGNSYGYSYQGTGNKRNNGTASSFGNTYTTNDIIGIAMDLDNNKLYFSKNGTWENSGDPTSGATGTGAAFTLTAASSTNAGYYFACCGHQDNNAKWSMNFGNGYFGTTAVSSAQNPDDGIGIFEYDVPTGYRALCTKSINAQEYS